MIIIISLISFYLMSFIYSLFYYFYYGTSFKETVFERVNVRAIGRDRMGERRGEKDNAASRRKEYF